MPRVQLGARVEPELRSALEQIAARLTLTFGRRTSVAAAIAWLVEVGQRELDRLDGLKRQAHR